MKTYLSLIPFVVFALFSIPAQVFAQSAGSCPDRSTGLSGNEKIFFMKACLAQAAEPSNVREEQLKHKTASCRQNAKNQHIEGKDLQGYVEICINSNEAKDAYAESAS